MQRLHEQRWLTQKEAAHLVGVQPRTIRRWVAQGRLAERITPGGRPRYRPEDILSMDQPTITGEEE